jgi:UDP-N-acetylglucosamine/UDP-N-acetylgalactosamine diphosphorylase
VLALRGGALAVVEYTELRDEHRNARDASEQLVYWAGNAAIHLFSVEFVRKAAEQADCWLAYHASAKKIPFLDASGRVLGPDEPNAHKLERFVFDVLPYAERACIVEALVADEFSPIKNAHGSESPATARRDLDACYRRWLTAAGTQFPPDDTWIEIDHSRIDDASEACDAGFRSVADAGAVIRVANGSER